MLARQQIPNLLTFARVLAVPICLAIMLLNPAWKAPALLWVFIAASLTDFLDGTLARRWNVVSPIGALLDPIADKLLVALMLVYLLLEGGLTPFASLTPAASGSAEPTHGLLHPFSGSSISPLFLPVVIILLRELYISGLREFLASRQITLPVSKIGKWKTALQMVAVALLLAALAYAPPTTTTLPPLFCAAPFAAAFSSACDGVQSATFFGTYSAQLGLPLLYASALLAFTSAVSYTRAALKQLR